MSRKAEIGVALVLAFSVALIAWLSLRDDATPGSRSDPPVVAANAPRPSAAPDRDVISENRRPANPVTAEVSPPPQSTLPEPRSSGAAPTVPVSDLEIRFLRQGAPCAGISVWVATDGDWPLATRRAAGAMPPASAVKRASDSEGRISLSLPRWTDLAVAFDSLPENAPRSLITTEVSPGATYTVALGDAVLRGTVFDAAGRPWPNVGVSAFVAATDGNTASVGVTHRTLTTSAGTFQFDDLIAGPCSVTMDPQGTFGGSIGVERLRARLRSGENVCDFGTAGVAGSWIGKLMNAAGEVVPNARIELVDELGGRELATRSGPDGAFLVPARAGRWTARAFYAGNPSGGFQLGMVSVPEHDFARDLTVPGAVVRGAITAPGGYSSSGLGSVPVTFRPKAHNYDAATRKVLSKPDGTFTIDGLDPSVWNVDIRPLRLEGSDPMELVVTKGDSVLHLELPVKL